MLWTTVSLFSFPSPALSLPLLASLSTSCQTELRDRLPKPQIHPLPATLKQWEETNLTDEVIAQDYFDRIEPSNLGFLLWSRFPVRVYLEPVDTSRLTAGTLPRRQAEMWLTLAAQAISDWSPYLPLIEIEEPDSADIVVKRSIPPLRQPNPNTTATPFLSPRARTATTEYGFYFQESPTKETTIGHRFTIYVRPDRASKHVLGSLRHELGHALGLWGHSPNPEDVMYTRQTANPPDISARDLLTLKHLYQQPTRLGWPLQEHCKQAYISLETVPVLP